ncbi:MAG: rhodanese-like domain-containing protein [Deltaproteobacteria bacterium]|nr:rhodanese-like domain-containing protein [Deltaproteobacteria bacterium]
MNFKRNLLLALTALLLGGAILSYQHRPLPSPVDATWADAQREAERGGYRLITTQELAARYQQEPHSVLLVDTRQDWEFMSGYIQGALHFPIEPTWWGRWRAEKPLLALLGPDKNRPVVFY